MKKTFLFVCVAVLACGVLAGCGVKDEAKDPSSKPLVKVRVLLDWTPNTNHTGMYVALEKGYYTAQGLDVEIVSPAEDTVLEALVAGRAEFGVSFQESVTFARTADTPLPVVAVAAVIQHNTSGFAAPVSKNIRSPKDFEGKRYGGWGTPLEESIIARLMGNAGADVGKVTFISDNATDFMAALERNIDFSWIYEGWDGMAAKEAGMDLTFMKLQDLDPKLDFYTPVLACSESLIQEQPDLIETFLKATSLGYADCISDSDGSAAILVKHAPEIDAALAQRSQRYLADEYQSDAPRWGEMKTEVWENFAEFLYENGIITRPLDAAKAYTNGFLPAP